MTMMDVLPPDVRRDDRGQLVRDRLRFRAFVRADGEPWTSEADGPRFEEHDKIPHPCVVAGPTDSDDELERKRQQAVSTGADFYHPRLGWLANGRKREQEWPQNLGNDVILRERVRRPAPLPEDAPAPVETIRAEKAGRER